MNESFSSRNGQGLDSDESCKSFFSRVTKLMSLLLKFMLSLDNTHQ